MISNRLAGVITRQLGIGSFEFTDDTTADQVPGWDSLAHVGIIAAVEQEYNVRFRSLEVIRLKNVGQLQGLVDRKTTGGS